MTKKNAKGGQGGKKHGNVHRIPTRLSADFSAATLQARREWNDILTILKDKQCQPRMLYPANLLFRYEGEIKALSKQIKVESVHHH